MKEKQTGEDGSYQTAQVGHGDGQERKARLEKMVATTQFRLALETEEERRAIKKLDFIWILYLDFNFDFGVFQGMSSLAL